MLEFNANDYVYIRLTDHGRQCLRKNYDNLARWYGGKLAYPFELPKTDVDGWVRWQLWRLMQELGPHTHIGGHAAFELNVRFDEADFKPVAAPPATPRAESDIGSATPLPR